MFDASCRFVYWAGNGSRKRFLLDIVIPCYITRYKGEGFAATTLVYIIIDPGLCPAKLVGHKIYMSLYLVIYNL
jgi:hypothetical protein